MSEERKVEIGEVVDVIDDLISNLRSFAPQDADEELIERAIGVIGRLVGPERETRSRLTSKHLVADEEFCELLARDLSVSKQEVREWFLGEPVKRVFAVAMWALDQVDDDVGDGVHGQRGPKIAELLTNWAIQNHAGLYRMEQPNRQYVEEEV